MATSSKKPGKKPDINRELAVRWGQHRCFFREGWVGVPVSFLRHYGNPAMPSSGLTASEAMFVLQLMSFKWTADAPFPSYHTLADRMGITDKQVRRYAQALEKKGLLVRSERIGTSNTFNLESLFTALHHVIKAERLAAKNNPVTITRKAA
jgi:hypothetical protein